MTTNNSSGDATQGAWAAPAQPLGGTPATPAPQQNVRFPLAVRYSKTGGYMLMGAGGLWFMTALLSRGRVVPLLLGILLVVVGAIQVSGRDYIVIERDIVKVKSQIGVTSKKVPINGIADLQLSGKKLLRRSDGKKIVRLFAFGTNKEDAAKIAAIIDGAPPSTDPYSR